MYNSPPALAGAFFVSPAAAEHFPRRGMRRPCISASGAFFLSSVEQFGSSSNQKVTGSNPVPTTTESLTPAAGFGFVLLGRKGQDGGQLPLQDRLELALALGSAR